MTFEIIKDMAMPEATRTRTKGEFAIALGTLEVGDGFIYPSKGKIASLYPRVSPAKHGGKKFKIAAGDTEGTFKVKRVK